MIAAESTREEKWDQTASVLMSSKCVEYATPLDFYMPLDAEFSFTCDVCALPTNAKHSNFYSPEINGLKQDWTGVCWMNPPYGRTIGLWVKKAYESSLAGATVVCLLPARTDTKWFQDLCLPHGELRFVRGRLRFGDSANSAPFPCVVVIFRGKTR